MGRPGSIVYLCSRAGYVPRYPFLAFLACVAILKKGNLLTVLIAPKFKSDRPHQKFRRNRAAAAYSILSFAFAAAVVCHCMLPGSSAPPRFSGRMWSTTYPGQAPERFPVEGQGWDRRNAVRAAGLRLIRPWLSRRQPTHCTVAFRREEYFRELLPCVPG